MEVVVEDVVVVARAEQATVGEQVPEVDVKVVEPSLSISYINSVLQSVVVVVVQGSVRVSVPV